MRTPMMRWIFVFTVMLFTSALTYAGIDATTAPLKPGQGEFETPLLGNLDCTNAIAISCPETVSGQTIEYPNNVSYWSCGFTDPGGEIIYELTLETVMDLTITILEQNEGCIDVYFLEQCDEQPCTWIGSETGDARMIHDIGPGTFYVVVDRWIGCSPGSYDFELQFDCNPPPPSCNYIGRSTENLGRLNWYADGEWSSVDGLIYQVFRGGFLPAAPDVVVFNPTTGDVVRSFQLSFTTAAQRGIAVDARNGNLWIAGWINRMIYYVDDAGSLIHSFGHGPLYAGLAYDPDNQRLWAVTNNAPDKYFVYDVSNPLEPTLLWGPTPVPWQCGGTFFGTNFNGAGLEYSPFSNSVIFINQDGAAQECFHDNGDGTLTPMGCCQLSPLQWPWGCALIDGAFGDRGALFVTSLDEWPFGPWLVDVFETVCDAMLPVELSSFTATGRNGYIDLAWTTASELNTAHFNVYRRQTTSTWREIAQIPSQGNGTFMRDYTYKDEGVRVNQEYEYLLADVDLSGLETRADNMICRATALPEAQPTDFALYQNYPNPFNPETTIRYDVGKAGHVQLQVFDITGRLVSTLESGYAAAGSYSVVFDGSELPSGIYLVVLDAERFRAVTKIVLAK